MAVAIADVARVWPAGDFEPRMDVGDYLAFWKGPRPRSHRAASDLLQRPYDLNSDSDLGRFIEGVARLPNVVIDTSVELPQDRVVIARIGAAENADATLGTLLLLSRRLGLVAFDPQRQQSIDPAPRGGANRDDPSGKDIRRAIALVPIGDQGIATEELDRALGHRGARRDRDTLLPLNLVRLPFPVPGGMAFAVPSMPSEGHPSGAERRSVIAGLGHRDPRSRRRAALALGGWPAHLDIQDALRTVATRDEDKYSRALAAVGLAVQGSDDDLVMDVAGDLVRGATTSVEHWGRIAASVAALAAAITTTRSKDPLRKARLLAYLSDLASVPGETERAESIREATDSG